MSLTPSARKVLTARLREHSADDLAMMVEWLTGCRCKAANCHACNYMQPNNYTTPDTYLRPEKCAKYITLAAQAAAKGDAPEAKPAALDKTRDPDKALALVIAMVTCRERRDIVGYDESHTKALKHAIKAIGGRDAIAANLGHARDAWPGAWAAALDHIAAKQESAR